MSASIPFEAESVVWLRAGGALAATARREAAELARRVNMGPSRIAEIELAVTEAATNLLRHADDGALALRVISFGGRAAVEFLSLDHGPGIPDLGSALRDGVSSTDTLGIGLGALARLADTFDIHSVPGRGTTVLARFRAPDSPTTADRVAYDTMTHVAGLTRPISGEAVCGDTWSARFDEAHDGGPGTLTVMMCDGLGHGPLAARVSERARLAFRETTRHTPADVLRELHRDLRGTRGAAVAVAAVDLATRRVTLCGAGNISAFVAGPDQRSALLSQPGIVGAQMPPPRLFSALLPTGSALVLHSDGLSDRWAPKDLPGLFSCQPAVIAGQILAQAGVRRDDAGIVVVVPAS
ncbi:ATP-binding SpoIIE family protein phosphatase [Streptomyces sp. LE64]|uniref:ATP-binding SpoIIE family protein phosphatase n=1 Tax=Streptomyces sp. LE64 TaxID=3448653 RepID=UPI0040413725